MRAVAFIGTLLVAGIASAQEPVLRIVPVPAADGAFAEIARTAAQVADGSVMGGGRWLRVDYASETELVGFVAPMIGTQFDPTTMLRFALPASTAGSAEIDLSVTPSWSAAEKMYYVSFVSPASSVPPDIRNVVIVAGSAGDSIGTALSHLTESETFIVSTYHFLRGYRVLGTAIVPILALLTVLIAGAFLLWKRGQAATALVAVGLGAHLLYGARVDLDLARLTMSHVVWWFDEQVYAEAGSMYDLADDVRAVAGEKDVRLLVCFDSTDYFGKLLRYLLYPLPVQIGPQGDLYPTYVAVIRKLEWSYEDGRLKCDSIDAPATLVRTYPDGTHLFDLTQP